MNIIQMKIIRYLFVVFLFLVWWYSGTLTKYIQDKHASKKLREGSNKTNKKILNLGCGRTNYGDINADLKHHGNVKHFMKVDANKVLPFSDKQFHGVFASNIIEHLPNPNFSLVEMERVADKVYIGRPRWWQLGTWLTPDHIWLVFKKKDGFKFVAYSPLWIYIILFLFSIFLFIV